MTDQGRGYGSQPWNPAEPGYGEQPNQAAVPNGQGYVPQDPYTQQQFPQAQVPGRHQDPYGQGQYVVQGQPYGEAQGYVPQAPYLQQQGQYVGQDQYGRQWQQQPYPQQQYPVPGQQQGGFPQQGGAPQQGGQGPEPVLARPAGPGPDGIDWEAEAAALDHPHAQSGEFAPQEHYAEDGEAAEYYEGDYADGEYLDEEYVEGEHAGGEHAQDEYAEEEAEHESFFEGGEQDTSREAERKRKEKGKKSGRRNRSACLLVALVLLGGMGGAGWWGYGFYEKTFGPPADYVGQGTGSVSIEIKNGELGGDMGSALMNAGVVKSAAAFRNAYNRNSKAVTIQPGFYTMKLQMSADAAVQLLVTAAGGDALIVPEGKKASDIYALIDAKLKLNSGTTAGVAKAQAATLGLPAYAGNNPEGFLWPTKYSIGQGMKPEDLLKQMVSNANDEYARLIPDGAAQKVGLKSAYDVITEASILQAEGNNSQDFGKMARVINNRLNTDVTHHTLGMDTTLQYSVGSKTLTKAQINDGSNKYNTYINQGLPPTPISNPGEEAINAVLNPTEGSWAYFIAMSPTETRFSTSPDEFKQNVKEYCTSHGEGFDDKAVHCA